MIQISIPRYWTAYSTSDFLNFSVDLIEKYKHIRNEYNCRLIVNIDYGGRNWLEFDNEDDATRFTLTFDLSQD